LNNPEKTINITGFGDLKNAVLCSPGSSRKIGPDVYALLLKHNKTACNYVEPRSGGLITCVGTEDLRFTKCDFGVDEVHTASSTCCSLH
jgi:hypothetical protein